MCAWVLVLLSVGPCVCGEGGCLRVCMCLFVSGVGSVCLCVFVCVVVLGYMCVSKVSERVSCEWVRVFVSEGLSGGTCVDVCVGPCVST